MRIFLFLSILIGIAGKGMAITCQDVHKKDIGYVVTVEFKSNLDLNGEKVVEIIQPLIDSLVAEVPNFNNAVFLNRFAKVTRSYVLGFRDEDVAQKSYRFLQGVKERHDFIEEIVTVDFGPSP